MKKNILVAVLIACLLECGCVSTKTILNYKEKDDSRKSAVKQCYGAEIAKRPNPKYVFPLLKWQLKDMSYTVKYRNNDPSIYGVYGLLLVIYPIFLAPDIVSTIFISPFTKTASTENGKIILSGQLVDENNNPIKNYNFDVEWNNVSTDSNGYFFKQIELNGSYKKDITITFFQSKNFTDLSNDFNEGKQVTIINPYKIKYSLKDNGEIKIEESIIEIRHYASYGDSLVVNWSESNNLKSDKIVLTKTEVFSEKNKQITIEAQKDEEKRKIEEQKAEEKRIVEEKIAKEKAKTEFEKTEKKILGIVDKLENTKDISQYSIHDIQTALNRVGMKYDEEAYKALMEVNKGTFVCFPMQILQVMQNGLLLNYPNSAFVIYVDFNNTETLYDGKWIRIKGKITGTYRYITSYGTVKTVPRVYAYIISDVSEY